MDNYCSLKKEEVFRELNTSEEGLTSLEANERLNKYGNNSLKEKDKRTILGIFLSQFKSAFILILLLATIILFILGETVEAIVIIGIILLSSILGSFQEFKSDKALKLLKKYITFKSKVQRDGKRTEIDVKDLVPGDIVFLNLGDVVPADLRIIESKNLYANESSITGESYPVKKDSLELKEYNIGLSKQSNILFMGSEISGGFCKGVVILTGKSTEYGKTATILSSREPQSDFQKGISSFGSFLTKVIFIMAIIIFIINFFLGKGAFNSFLFAVALAVGVTPELLPVIMTISMSKGAIKMAEKKVIIKKLISIEDLGNMDVLCTDKTGTLTENKNTINNYFDINGKREEQIIEYALVCNSILSSKNKSSDNILDKTIVEYADSNGIKYPEYKRIEDIEFDYKRKRMSSIVEIDEKRILICKGNTLSLLDVCSKIKYNGKIVSINSRRDFIKKKFEELSKKGLRVISIAYQKVETKKEYTIKDERNLIFMGFITFFDPPKKDVGEIIKKLDTLGIEVKILTGDNELVTEEICKEVGFKIKGRVLCGEDLESMNESEFLKAIEESNVFARILPEQKSKIVSGLIKNKHVTGFLGDGINDAQAIKVADVGITVESAVNVAKENADIILLNKGLGVIAEGVLEGRKTFGNSTKYIRNTISANFENMFILSISSFYFKFVPLIPSQILLINFITGVPLITLSSDNVDKSYMKKPKKWRIEMIRKFMIFFGLISLVFDALTIMLVWFFVAPGNMTMFRTVWFTESILSEILITFSLRTKESFWKSKPSKLLVGASILGVALTLLVVFSSLNKLFEVERLTLTTIIIILAILICYFVIVEIGKKIFYSKISKED
jgi:P-type Mg2+ transporter